LVLSNFCFAFFKLLIIFICQEPVILKSSIASEVRLKYSDIFNNACLVGAITWVHH